MVMLESADELDKDQWETFVSVHSPVVRSNHEGNSYTTYAVSLKSNNSCFSQPYSCIRRRYSEFARLRNILREQHPNVDAPPLPPKKLFKRFNQSFINDRTEGLQTFLREVLEIPVYLSNKAIHMFLQSSCSMNDINKEVLGEDCCLYTAIHTSDSCSDTSSEHTEGGNSITDLEDESVANCRTDDNQDYDEIGTDAMDLLPKSDQPNLPTMRELLIKRVSEPVPILPPYLRPMVAGSAPNNYSSSPRISPSNSSAESEPRHVSFCDKVKVAVVRDQFWNIGTKPIRTCLR